MCCKKDQQQEGEGTNLGRLTTAKIITLTFLGLHTVFRQNPCFQSSGRSVRQHPPSLSRATAGSHGSQVAACRGEQLQMDVKGHLWDKSKQEQRGRAAESGSLRGNPRFFFPLIALPLTLFTLHVLRYIRNTVITPHHVLIADKNKKLCQVGSPPWF